MVRVLRPNNLILMAIVFVFGPSASLALGQALPSFPVGVPAYSATVTAAQGGTGTWLGGDAPSVVSLNGSPSQTIWTFGDCFIAPQGQTTRPTFPMGNVLCVATDNNGTFSPTYFFKGTAANPQPFFPDPASSSIPGGSRFWPSRSFVIGNYLYIIMVRILNGTASGSLNNGQYYGTVIVRVYNPTDYPSNWNYDYLDLSPLNTPAPTSSTFLQPYIGNEALPLTVNGDSSLAIYGTFGVGPNTKTIAVKIENSVLLNASAGNISTSVQYLNSSFQWVYNYTSNSSNYWDVQIPSGTWFSVRYNPGSQLWQAVFVPTQNQTNSDGSQKWLPYMAGMDSTSTGSPFGPWQPLKYIYQFPEMTQGNALYDPGNFCYPGPGAELSLFAYSPNTYIAFDYVCNSTSTTPGKSVATNNGIYYPKVGQVVNPLP